MRELVTEGCICVQDNMGIEYCVSEITYRLWENEEFEYIFRPNYSVIDLLDSSVFQGIPGLDLDKRREEYVRKNIVPVFISERSPNANREDLWALLEACGMDYLNQLEWLIRTDMHYSGDKLYVKAYDARRETEVINADEEVRKFTRSRDVLRRILDYVCGGYNIEYQGMSITDSNRLLCYNLLYGLYKKEETYIKGQQQKGIKAAKAQGKYKGRKQIKVEATKFYEVARKYKNKKISADEAAGILGISRSTFFRRLKAMD